MEGAFLTDPVRLFLIQAIGSIERLDLLLLMRRHADRWWTARALADELHVSPDVVESDLGLLGARNLISVRIAQDVLYQFSPGTSELQHFVDALSQAHSADRRTVAALVTRPVSEEARRFAEAFRLRKGSRDDG